MCLHMHSHCLGSRVGAGSRLESKSQQSKVPLARLLSWERALSAGRCCREGWGFWQTVAGRPASQPLDLLLDCLLVRGDLGHLGVYWSCCAAAWRSWRLVGSAESRYNLFTAAPQQLVMREHCGPPARALQVRILSVSGHAVSTGPHCSSMRKRRSLQLWPPNQTVVPG